MDGLQLLPALDEEQYQALKADIAQRGVMVPVEYDEEGNLLDGHHRVRACEELGIKEWPSFIRCGMTQEQKEEHVLKLNLARRHLLQQERELLAINLQRRGWSKRRIADTLSVNHSTICRWLNDSGGADAPPENIKVTGKDGKSYPATRKSKTTVAKNKIERQKALDALTEIPVSELPNTIIDVRRLSRLEREYQAEQRALTVAGDFQAENFQLWLGDFRDRGQEIVSSTVDLIFTDPPYPQEALPLWDDLGLFAARVLKQSGLLVAYTGAMYLPEVIASLSKHLTYHWCGAVVLNGPHSRVHNRKIVQGSKQLLFFVRKDYSGEVWFEDTCQSESEQKENHDWQQSLGPALYYLSVLCPEGGLVVDPFLGGGTTGAAAQRLKRSFIGIELDPAAFASAQERLSGQ